MLPARECGEGVPGSKQCWIWSRPVQKCRYIYLNLVSMTAGLMKNPSQEKSTNERYCDIYTQD